MLACERGNKLSEVEDRAEELDHDAKVRNTVRAYDPSHTNKCTIISVCLIQRQIGGSHNAYFKQESSVYPLLTEMQLFVCIIVQR